MSQKYIWNRKTYSMLTFGESFMVTMYHLLNKICLVMVPKYYVKKIGKRECFKSGMNFWPNSQSLEKVILHIYEIIRVNF